MTARRVVAAVVGLAAAGCSPEAVTVPEPVAPTTAPPAVPETTTTTEVAVTPDEPLVVRPATTTLPTWRPPEPVPIRNRQTNTGGGNCGGDLPSCAVLNRESGGDPNAVNPTGCGGRGCYGKWQFDPRTSQALGYPGTMDQYDEATQDEAARRLYADGSGCSHWGAC